MHIVSIKPGSGEDQQRIELSDGSIFSFKTCYLPPVFTDEDSYTPGTADGRDISMSEEEAFRFASACLRAEKAALQLITRAEQNVFHLTLKLEKRGHDTACIRAVVAHLSELGFLDDLRYASLWLEARISRQAASPWRLLAALRARGIDRHDAEAALKEALDSETEQLLLERYVQKLQKRKTGGDGGGAEDRSLRFTLKNEGFSPAAIQCFFDNYSDSDCGS
ncbi:MAG: recombination regulator RecX [Treponema sp.]|nr:recombination regulator RecX [Treponema sp.]